MARDKPIPAQTEIHFLRFLLYNLLKNPDLKRIASGYGNHIRIDHGFGYQSLYAHLYKYNVKVGQTVKRGDIIGFVGSTGRSAAPHLHYEIFKDGERINPRNFYYKSLTSEEFDEMLKASSAINETLG